MNNLDKAKQASKLAADIDKCKNDISRIKSAIESLGNEYRHMAVKIVDGSLNTDLPANKDIFDLFLLQAEGRLREKEIELDKLLNGEVNKIKSIIEERECE